MDNPILKYFECAHLPERLQDVSKPFNVLAHHMNLLIVLNSAEKSAFFRKLLEAKDCAVRAALDPQPEVEQWSEARIEELPKIEKLREELQAIQKECDLAQDHFAKIISTQILLQGQISKVGL